MISFFNKNRADVPASSMGMDEWLLAIKTGTWRKQIEGLRGKKDKLFKIAKNNLPGVTVSGLFKTRDKGLDLHKRLISHSGFIAIDVDKKDNPKMRASDLVDKEAYAQFISCSGEGKKLIYRCSKAGDAAEHRRIYDAVIKRLKDKGIKLKVDPIVKSIASLQYVSYDPELYHNPKTKLVIKPLPAIKETARLKPAAANVEEELTQLHLYIDSLGDRDVTADYEAWMLVMFGISYTFGEAGRDAMHRLCSNYSNYSKDECDEKYDACLERRPEELVNPVTVASVYQLINDKLPKVTMKHLAKRFNKSHAVGIGEEAAEGASESNGDLNGLVRYKLFLFKKVIEKDTGIILELIPHGINLNEFENLLRAKGFYRHDDLFVHIVNNKVDIVDVPDILRIITEHVERDGDYHFLYKKTEFRFSWEELAHLWRTIRANANTYNQVVASLAHWQPNLLKDEPAASYIPYRNCVVKVDAKGITEIPYSEIHQQIWREKILPRDFTPTRTVGMFEEFFVNVAGRGKDAKTKKASEAYKRAVWYFGYMLQGTKRQSTARAWILYDNKAGNNGRTGKTIIGQAVGKIRSVTVIDGKQVDFRNRFAFQTVSPWTDVVFIDDPSKYMSLVPLFNMISGTLTADKKGTAPIEKPVKFMIASNFILEAEGNSEAGRQFVTQLDDYYVRYARNNGNTISPIVHAHGKEFFTDWDDRDWCQFDNFALRAIQYHLAARAPDSEIVGNALEVRFIQLYEEELYQELLQILKAQSKPDKTGKYMLVPQSSLVQAIKESGAEPTSVKAGRVARAFLVATGGTDISVTGMVVAGGVTRQAYRYIPIKGVFR